MKKYIVLTIMILAAGTFTNSMYAKKSAKKSTIEAAKIVAAPVKLSTSMDSLSYYIGKINALGYLASMSKNTEQKLDKEAFVKGLNYAMQVAAKDPSMMQGLEMGMSMFKFQSQAEKQFGEKLNMPILANTLEKTILADNANEKPDAYNDSIQKVIQTVMDRKAAEGEAKGNAFIQKTMKEDPSYKVTPSGLAYKVIKAGNDSLFKPTDKVQVIYTGSHADGKVFDSSNGKTTTFSPNQVVPGFKEALLMMSPGAEYKILIPGKLAYGPRGQQQAGIEPNELLVFEINTVGVEPEKAEAPSVQKADKAPKAKTATKIKKAPKSNKK